MDVKEKEEVGKEIVSNDKLDDKEEIIHETEAKDELDVKEKEEVGKEIATSDENIFLYLLDKDKRSLVYHSIKLQDKNKDKSLYPALVRSIIISLNTFSTMNTDLENVLSEDYSKLINYKNEFENFDNKLLASAATIQPTLYALGTSASQLLENLNLQKLDNFYHYCKAITDFGNKPIELDVIAIKGDLGIEQNRAVILEDIQMWWNKITHMNMQYGMAGKIRHKLIMHGGLLYNIYTTIVEKNKSCKEILDSLSLEGIEQSKRVEQYIRKIEDGVNTAHKGSIVAGGPFRRLKTLVEEGLSYANQWESLFITKKDFKNNSYKHDSSIILKNTLSEYESKAKDELEGYKNNSKTALGKIAASLCLESIENLEKIFDPNNIYVPKKSTLSLKGIVNSNLLRINGLLLDNNWEPEVDEDNIKLDTEIKNCLFQDNRDWIDVLKERCARCEYESASRILEFLKDDNIIIPDEIEEMFDSKLLDCRFTLQQVLKTTYINIESAVTVGVLKEDERAENISIVDQIKHQLDSSVLLRFSTSISTLDRVNKIIDIAKAEYIELISERFEKFNLDEKEKKRIDKILDKSDVLTANEYLYLLENNEKLPEDDIQIKNFDKFFPEQINKLEKYLNAEMLPVVIRTIRNGKSIAGLKWDNIPNKQREQAADMFEEWVNLKREKKINKESLNIVFTALGFNVLDINIEVSNNSTSPGFKWVNLSTQIIQDKEQCPVPIFGSQANGIYRVLCDWESPTFDSIINEIDSSRQSNHSPIIVLFFRRLSENRRRELAKLTREKNKSFIIIDDLVTLFLCFAKGNRLPILFDITLPFASIKPYTSTAGLVPPEMFYGREHERNQIIDPMGSCFIYGGRQLGKTALLRDIERTQHSPLDGFIVIWIELKAKIGYEKSIDDLWYFMLDKLSEYGIVDKKNVRKNIKFEQFERYVTNWLNEDSSRRILFLLDESDHFLEVDSMGAHRQAGDTGLSGYYRTTQLKNLMENTNRRFKIVFAGLHNVQRTTKLSNHPLAHFGENLCIGPLLGNREDIEARRLIKKPLESIGYKISDDLVTKILSQTNYYPSLIQLYNQVLLDHIVKSNLKKFKTKDVPPYIILSKHIDEAYNSKDLKTSIRERFIWTLQLDQRYEVIAYSIALHEISLKNGQNYNVGFPVDWIEKEVTTWWAEGFSNKSGSNIENLLDEMVDLGILRKTNHGYALRSLNVGLLLGTLEDIEKVLEVEREPRLEYLPEISRSTFVEKNKVDYTKRNPLTVSQESIFKSNRNSASIIFGSVLSGITDIVKFLKIGSFENIKIMEGISSFSQYQKELDQVIKNRSKHKGSTIAIVNENNAWNNTWVTETQNRLLSKKMKSTDTFLQIIFLADDKCTMRILEGISNTYKELKGMGVKMIKLSPWHDDAQRRWLEESGYINMDKEKREKIFDITGNWQASLYDFNKIATIDKSLDKISIYAEKIVHDYFKQYIQYSGLDHLTEKDLNVITILSELDDEAVSIFDIKEFTLDNLPMQDDEIYKVLKWASLLNYVNLEKNDLWRIDPFISTLVKYMQNDN